MLRHSQAPYKGRISGPRLCEGVFKALLAAAGKPRERGDVRGKCSKLYESASTMLGMLADFIVLDRDITACDPSEIQSAQVIATYVGGRQVFER